MNILRTIKLKKIFGDFDCLNEQEKYFFSFFSNLEEVRIEDTILFYTDKNEQYFDYIVSQNKFWVSHIHVTVKIQKKFNFSNSDAQKLVADSVEKYLGFKDVLLFCW